MCIFEIQNLNYWLKVFFRRYISWFHYSDSNNDFRIIITSTEPYELFMNKISHDIEKVFYVTTFSAKYPVVKDQFLHKPFMLQSY